MAWYADKLIAAVGGDYTTLTLFEAAYDGEDISATDGVRARIKGTTSDAGTCTFANWQAGQSASCKIVITAETAYGLQDRVAWKGADGSGDDAIFPAQIMSFTEATNALYVDIYNLEILKYLNIASPATGNVYRVWNCFFRDSSTMGAIYAVGCGTTTVYAANLLLRDYAASGNNYGIAAGDADLTLYAWNITIDTGSYGLYSLSTATDEYRNIVGINLGNKFAYDANVSDDYCAADDAYTNGAHSIENIVIADNFTNDPGEDYTVKDTGADIYHAGTDQPAWFDTLTGGKDIRGVAWHATTPSMGCFEYEEAGGTPYYKSIEGTITPGGMLQKGIVRSFSGGFTPSGSLVRQSAKTFTGGITPTGTLANVRARLISLMGSIASSGTLIKAVARSLGGTLAAAGALTKKTSRNFAGALTPSGALANTKAKLISLAGSIVPVGIIARNIGKSISGSIVPAGSIIKSVSKLWAGSLTPSGLLSASKAKLISLAGSIVSTGTLVKMASRSLTGSITPVGSIIKAISRTWSGVLDLVGAVVNSLTAVGRKLDVAVSDAAVYGVAVSDSAVTDLAISDAAVYGVAVSDSAI